MYVHAHRHSPIFSPVVYAIQCAYRNHAIMGIVYIHNVTLTLRIMVNTDTNIAHGGFTNVDNSVYYAVFPE